MRCALALLAVLTTACGGDADSVGIGATCQQTADCGDEMRCLTAYAGGLCAKVGCSAHGDCPEPGLCVLVGDEPLCLRSCADKAECNANRSADAEANCLANSVLIDDSAQKVCLPPSSGD